MTSLGLIKNKIFILLEAVTDFFFQGPHFFIVIGGDDIVQRIIVFREHFMRTAFFQKLQQDLLL